MHKRNLQLRIPPEIDDQLNQLAPKSRSQFVREALVEKIQREKEKAMENKWIQALKRHPENINEAKRWLKAEAWD
jgi:Arc/MetJ-type ribon-helix-helix transcriptional regulator